MWNYFRMVRTRQGRRTNLFSVRRRDQDVDHEESQWEDFLADIASRVLSISIQRRSDEFVGLLDDTIFRQARVSQPKRAEQQGHTVVPLPVALMRASTPYADPIFFARIVKAVMENIGNALASILPVALVMPPTLVVMKPIDHVVALIWILKSMREMGYEPFLRDQNAKIIGRWIRKIEKNLIQI